MTKHIKHLLESYGLCMPLRRVWNSDPGAEYYVDFDALSPISLPLRGTDTLAYPQVEAEQDHSYEGSSFHAVANISPAIFNLPHDIHRRFASLVKTYGLQVVDRASFEILPSQSLPPNPETEGEKPKGDKAGTPGVGSPKGKEKAMKPVKELKFGRVEPRWMLWSMGGPCS
jgi:hypothetical protein